MAFDLGGKSNGTSLSTATQSAAVYFLPTVTDNGEAMPLVSPYPQGQGLATINTAYPASAAFTDPASTGVASMSSTETLLIIAALAAAAWYMLK